MADSNIEEILNKILSAVFGKDVRQAIHDGIEQCYEDGKVGAVDLVARQRIDNLAKLPEGSTTGDAELADIRVGADGNTYSTAGESTRKQFEKITSEINRIPQTEIILDLISYAKIGTVSNSGAFTETGAKHVKIDIPVGVISEKYADYFEDEPVINIAPDLEGVYQFRIWYQTADNEPYKAIPSASNFITTSREIIPLADVTSVFLQIARIDGGDISSKYDPIQAIHVVVTRLWEKVFEISYYYNTSMTRSAFDAVVLPVESGETIIIDGIMLTTSYARLDENFRCIDKINLNLQSKTGSVAYVKDSAIIGNYQTDAISRNFIIPEGIRYIAILKENLADDYEVHINSRTVDMDYDKHCVSALTKYYPKLKRYKGKYDRNNDTCQYIVQASASPAIVSSDIGVYYRPYFDGEPGDFWIFRDYKPKRFANTIARYGDIVWFDGTALRALRNPYAHEGGETAPKSHYDVVIVGGGAGGIGAAYALCNSGLRVCLCEKENNLGGTHTSGGVFSQIASPIGDWYKAVAQDAYNCAAMRFSGNKMFSSEKSNETEFDKLWRGSQHNAGSDDTGNLNLFSPYYLYQKYHNDLTNGGIEIRYNREFVSCEELNGTVISATFQNLVSGGAETVSADYFIDATGDCYLARFGKDLDTDYFIGSDPESRYNETAVQTLPSEPHYDINTLEQVYLYGSYNSAFNINSDGESFTAESPYAEKEGDLPNIEGVSKGQNTRGGIPYYNRTEFPPHSTNTSVYPQVCNFISPDYYCGITKQEFVDNGYEITRYFSEAKAKTHYKINNKSASTFFIETMPMLAIREGYRMKCEYMVTQKDVETTITSENYAEKHIVALSSWYVDIHQNTSIDTDSVACTYLNGIPYEAMIPCTQKNVLVACRGYGASHIGLAANRLTKTMLSLGYAAGKALIQAKSRWLEDVRDVNMVQLQRDIEIAELLTDIEENIL